MSESSSTTRLVRPLRGGQITIPVEFRKRLGITESTMLQVRLDDGELHIKPVQLSEMTEGSSWLQELYAYFAPVRQEIIDHFDLQGALANLLGRSVDLVPKDGLRHLLRDSVLTTSAVIYAA